LPPVNDPFIEAIVERLRPVIARQPDHAHDEIASVLRVSPQALHRLLEDREGTIDVSVLIDVVAAMVRELAVDPQWLLTGQYDSAMHRHALQLGEERSDESRHAIRDFVAKQFQRLRDSFRNPQVNQCPQ
jgi:hypothetical protein